MIFRVVLDHGIEKIEADTFELNLNGDLSFKKETGLSSNNIGSYVKVYETVAVFAKGHWLSVIREESTSE